MLTQELTPALYQTWRNAWAAHRDRLRPNRISGPALDRYLRHAYPLAPLTDPSALRIVTENVAHNAPWASKLPPGVPPQPVAYWVRDTGAGAALYRQQEAPFQGRPIFVGIELLSGFFCVEGSSLLWDELYVRRGLDRQDLQSPYCVAEYLACLQRQPAQTARQPGQKVLTSV